MKKMPEGRFGTNLVIWTYDNKKLPTRPSDKVQFGA